MSKKKVVTKKPTAWKGTETEEFKAEVVFPETYKEAEEMGYSEEMVMSSFEAHQTIRAQAVINSYVGKPADYKDGQYPTDADVQKAVDDFDFTTVAKRALTAEDKVDRILEDASADTLDAILAKLKERKKELAS